MNTHATKLGVAVIGLGIGQEHSQAYMETGSCDLRWVYDIDQDKSRNFALLLGGAKSAENYDQILADSSVDIISIASYDHLHYDQAIQALQAGKHIFVEKPLCRTEDELYTLHNAWINNSEYLYIASNLVLRTAPLYRWLKQQIKQDEFGEIYAFDGDYLYGRLEKITEGWRNNVPDYSAMLGGGIHMVDLMLWLTDQRPDTVLALGNRIATQNTFFSYQDFVIANMRFPSSLIGRISVNLGSVHPHQHVLRIFGTKASFIYDDLGPRVYKNRNPEVLPERLQLAPLPENRGGLIREFVEAILEGRNMTEDIQKMFDVISVCVASDKSSATQTEKGVIYL